MDEPLLARPVGDLLDAFAEPTPAPAGGSAAALAVSMGAALLSMAARISIDHWAEADEQFRARVLADLEGALAAEGYEPDPALVEALRARFRSS